MKPLSDHIQPELSPARRARQREAIHARLAHRRSPLRWAAVAVPAAAALVTAVLVLRSPHSELAAEGDVLVAHGEQARRIALVDGSRIALQPGAQVSVPSARPERIELLLGRGRARFQVTKQKARTFRVLAGGVAISVVGTEFEVDLGKRGVRVFVSEGAVRVHRLASDEPPLLVEAGQTWPPEPPPATDTPPAPGGDVAAPSEQAKPQAPAEGAVAAPAATRAPPRAAPSVRSARASTAAELWGEANQALARQDHPAAASSLDALRRRFPSDARAALAALELGRLRLDYLGDPRGAIEPLEAALRLSPLGVLQEDIQARLVQAFDASGEVARCRQARERYLADHARGAHRMDVAARCPPP